MYLAKLKAFAECGQFAREKLRGTVGYMSPELILTGSVGKMTDIWAAGMCVCVCWLFCLLLILCVLSRTGADVMLDVFKYII